MISRHSEDVFEYTLNAIQEGPVIAMVWEGVGAISIARKLVGTTYPDQSPPGTIRGDYAHISQDYANQQKRGVHNLVHASGNAKEAKLEISHSLNRMNCLNIIRPMTILLSSSKLFCC